MSPIGVALIGGGIFIKEQHLPAVLKCSSLSLKAIFSRSLHSAQDTASLLPASTPVDLYSTDAGVGKTYHNLLLREDVAAVIIALPILAQPEYIEAALSAGKHVLAEKPIAPDMAGAKKLIEFAKNTISEKGATLAIAENYRFFPHLVYAREEGTKLGELKQFSVMGLLNQPKDGKYYNTPWRTKPEFQGGFVLDAGIHFAAGVRLFLQGESVAETVHAFTSRISEHLVPIDTAHAIIKLKSGALGSFQISMGSAFDLVPEYRLEYAKGTIHIVGTKVTTKAIGAEANVKEFARTSGVSEEVAAWVEALAKGQPDPRQSPDLALGDLEFLDGILKSAAKGGQEQKLELQ